MKNILLAFVMLSVFMVSCDRGQSVQSEATKRSETDFDLEKARAAIQDKTSRFTTAHITQDTTYLNNIFTEDARVYPPGSEVVVGKQAISKLNADWVNYGIYEFRETSTRFYGNGNLLIDEGVYYLRQGKENAVEQGKYINIWQSEEGEWKICSNIWNSSTP